MTAHSHSRILAEIHRRAWSVLALGHGVPSESQAVGAKGYQVRPPGWQESSDRRLRRPT